MLKLFIVFFFLASSVSMQMAYAALSFNTIKTQAILANATYLEANQIQKAIQIENNTLIHQATLPNYQVSYFLSTNNEIQTIAIRGTANLENALLDLNLSLQTDTQLEIILHQGFSAATRAIYEDIKPYLIKDRPIVTTGHSLGGAISVILAMYLTKDDYDLMQITTFGQPKVTNVTGTKAFKNLPLIRVVTEYDIVPLVPPISPLQIKDLDIYWHMGEEIILLENGQYSQTNGVKSMLRSTKFISSLPNEKNMNAHKMDNYIELINGLLSNPIEIPYKTELSLWGISLD